MGENRTGFGKFVRVTFVNNENILSGNILRIGRNRVMQVNNPFQMNDWEIKKFLKVVLAIQLVMWGVIGLDAIGLKIPIIRQFIGFIYLTFVPGIVILRILKLHKLGNIETFLYTVGLSIATLMFTGLFMNSLYPIFGISRPISTIPLIITISVVVLILQFITRMTIKRKGGLYL